MRRMRTGALVLLIGLAATVMPAHDALAGGGGCHRQTEGAGRDVEMKGFCFTPTVLRTEPGETVTFVNRDKATHVVAGIGWGEGREMAFGNAFSQRFDEPGIYPYTCYLHPGMNGTVVVGDGSAGSFEPVASLRTAGDGSGGGFPWAWIGAVAAAALVAFAAGLFTRRFRFRRHPVL